METAFEYLPTPLSYQQEVLQEMYESEELFNEGLPSFEYLLYMDDEELDYFLGRVFRSVAKAAGGAVKAAGGVAKTVGKGLSAVDKIVPISVLTSGLAWTPVGMAVRAGLGAAQAAASGKNVLQGAVPRHRRHDNSIAQGRAFDDQRLKKGGGVGHGEREPA